MNKLKVVLLCNDVFDSLFLLGVVGMVLVDCKIKFWWNMY